MIKNSTSKLTQVILVDSKDNILGFAEKLTAHEKNLCHRAFSVILTNSNNTQILLHKRQSTKYHCANLWSNACCSHPKPNEINLAAAKKRLLFEMGIECNLKHIGAIYYQTKLANQLYEHEYDHLFHGQFHSNTCDFNIEEVAEVKWVTIEELMSQLANNPSEFTPWLKLIMEKFLRHCEQQIPLEQ